MAKYYTISASKYKSMPSAQSSSLGIKKTRVDGEYVYYTTNDAVKKFGGSYYGTSKPATKSSSKSSSSGSSSSSSSGSSSNNTSSSKPYTLQGAYSDDPDKYPYMYNGISYAVKADATAVARGEVSAPSVSSQSTSNNTTTSSGSDEPQGGTYDPSELKKSAEFKALSSEDQQAVLAVFGAVASNDQKQAARLTDAFKAAAKINDPYFAQQLNLAVDAIERGYVSIDKEAEYSEMQLKRRQEDLEQDYQSKKDFMSLEQASVMREIQRAYDQNLENLQNNLAATGFTQSSRRAKKEAFLNEATGDLRESKNRSFAYEQSKEDAALARGQRDTASEVARLKELTEQNKLDFLRKGEEQVGSDNLPRLSGAPDKLGDIYGSIPEQKLQNTISAATSFVF